VYSFFEKKNEIDLGSRVEFQMSREVDMEKIMIDRLALWCWEFEK
jgi:hypothetical protein